MIGRKPEGHAVGYPTSYSCLNASTSLFTNGELCKSLEVLCGFGRDIMNKAAGRVAAEKCALRPSEDFSALYVKKCKSSCDVRALINFIYIERDWGFLVRRKIVLAHAANVE